MRLVDYVNILLQQILRLTLRLNILNLRLLFLEDALEYIVNPLFWSPKGIIRQYVYIPRADIA